MINACKEEKAALDAARDALGSADDDVYDVEQELQDALFMKAEAAAAKKDAADVIAAATT